MYSYMEEEKIQALQRTQKLEIRKTLQQFVQSYKTSRFVFKPPQQQEITSSLRSRSLQAYPPSFKEEVKTFKKTFSRLAAVAIVVVFLVLWWSEEKCSFLQP